MTRIDAFSPQEREAIKKEIKQELHHEATRKRLLSCGVLAAITLLVIGLPILYVSAQLAKTGFYDVPVLSKSYYKPTVPVRTVLPLFGSKPDDIYRILGTKVRYEPATSQATLPVSEAEITTLVQHAIAAAPPDVLPFPVRTAQVAIDAEMVEIYAISPQKNRDATVRIRFKPTVKGGELRANVEEIAVGSLIVPKKIGDLLFAAFGAIVTDAAAEQVANVGSLVDIKLEGGVIKFVVIPKAR